MGSDRRVRAGRVVRHAAAALAALVLAWLPAHAAPSSLGDVRRVVPSGTGVAFVTARGTVLLEGFDEIGVRIRVTADTAFAPLRSPAVLREALVPATLGRSVAGDTLVFAAPGCLVRVAQHPFALRVTTKYGDDLFRDAGGVTLRPDGVRHAIVHAEGTRYTGLGEQATSLDRTRQHITLWNTDAYKYNVGDGPLYSSFPVYLAVHDSLVHGMFYDDPSRASFDFAGGSPDVVYDSSGRDLCLYVLPGPTMAEVLAQYTRLTGRAPLPPLWALGFHQSRFSYTPESAVYRTAWEFRHRRIPCDVLHLDIHYMQGFRVFTWDSLAFAHPAAMVRDLAAQNFKLVPIVDPGVKVDTAYTVYRDGLRRGAFALTPQGTPYVGRVWPGDCVFPDFTSAATREWWGNLHGDVAALGVRGIWNDMNEPSVFGVKTMPDSVRFPGGEASHALVHNQYGLLMARATFDGLRRARPDARPFVLSRAGYSGIQRYAAQWTGDNVSTWPHLAITIPMVAGLGLSGQPFAGADLGGYAGDPTPQMFTRFLQAGVLFPFFRVHSDGQGPRREPWAFGAPYEAANRAILGLRYRLLPTLYSAFWQHAHTGAPVMRPLFWDRPQDASLWTAGDEYFCGDHVLVAPVVAPEEDTRRVVLPRGRWYRFPDGPSYAGDRTVVVPAPRVESATGIDTSGVGGLPLFARAGGVVFTGPAQEWVGQDTTGAVEAHLYVGGEATSELYEDAGDGDPAAGWRVTRWRTTATRDAFVVRIGEFCAGVVRARPCTVVVHGAAVTPRRLTCDDRAVAFSRDAGGALRFALPPHTRALVVEW